MPPKNPVSKILLIIIGLLVSSGLIIFLSAALGLLAKEGAQFSSVVTTQIFIGLVGGSIIAYITSKIPYKFWKTYSFWIFLGAVILTAAVFIPGIGIEFAGAKRWIYLGPLSFQPGEFLKIAYLIYTAAWLSAVKEKINTFKYGTLPFILISAVAGGILFLQPDNDTAIVMLAAGAVMYFVSGANWKHIIVVGLLGLIGIAGVLASRPYVVDRIMTYINPSADALGSSYQIQQSLIAIGSGGLTGRGFGQSIQKFSFLPEPIGDSIFAVAAEEFGFIGALLLIGLFVWFLIYSIKLSMRSKETYGGLLLVGIATLIVGQAFVNISSMLGLIPLSGLPLLFVSHGGTALFFTLFAVGIMLNISRFVKKG